MFFNISYYSNRTMDSSPNCVTSKCQMKSIYSCHTHRNNIHKFARPHFCSGNPSFAFEITLCNSFHSLSSYIHGWLVHFDRRRIDLAHAGVMWDLYLWRISLFLLADFFSQEKNVASRRRHFLLFLWDKSKFPVSCIAFWTVVFAFIEMWTVRI